MSDDQDRRGMIMAVSLLPQRHAEGAAKAKPGQTRNRGCFQGP